MGTFLRHTVDKENRKTLLSMSGRYWGCYPESKGERVYLVSAGTYDPNAVNPSVCASQCGRWSFRYAALTEGKFCFCSTGLPTAAVTTDGYCNIPCSDTASATMCGGLNYIRWVNSRVVSSEISGGKISGNLFKYCRKFPEICQLPM